MLCSQRVAATMLPADSTVFTRHCTVQGSTDNGRVQERSALAELPAWTPLLNGQEVHCTFCDVYDPSNNNWVLHALGEAPAESCYIAFAQAAALRDEGCSTRI